MELEELLRWIKKCQGTNALNRYVPELASLARSLKAAGGSNAGIEKEARGLVDEIKRIDPQDVESLAVIRRSVGAPPVGTGTGPTLAPPAAPPPPVVKRASNRTAPTGTDLKSIDRGTVKLKSTAVKSFDSLEDEFAQLNQDLKARGLRFRVTSVSEMQKVKSAASQAKTSGPASDYDVFFGALVTALKLGAMDGVDEDAGEVSKFCTQFEKEFLRLLGGELERLAEMKKVNFDGPMCNRLSKMASDKGIYNYASDPKSLSRYVYDQLGKGPFAGVLPGEPMEIGKEEGGKTRTGTMASFGCKVVEFLRPLGVKPEVTGSLVIPVTDPKKLPNDIDINISTRGAGDRTELWNQVKSKMDSYKGETVDVGEGKMTVRPLSRSKVDPDNPNIWERRFCYDFKPGSDSDEKNGWVVPFELEVKDVGGDVWSDHLSDKAEERITQPSGMSCPRFLMLDCMKRIVDHRKSMVQKARGLIDEDFLAPVGPKSTKSKLERWHEAVGDEGVKLADSKRLWDKMQSALEMARTDPGLTEPLEDWLRKQVKTPDDYLVLITLAPNKSNFDTWLRKFD